MRGRWQAYEVSRGARSPGDDGEPLSGLRKINLPLGRKDPAVFCHEIIAAGVDEVTVHGALGLLLHQIRDENILGCAHVLAIRHSMILNHDGEGSDLPPKSDV